MEIPKRRLGRRQTTWRGTKQQDTEVLEMEEGEALDWRRWTRTTANPPPSKGGERLYMKEKCPCVFGCIVNVLLYEHP